MTVASENQYPYVTFAESASPGTPTSGLGYIYAATGGTPFYVDDAGTETSLLGGAFSGARCALTGTQSIDTATWTPISFGSGTETFDVGTWHDTSTNPSRFTVPSGVTYVTVHAAAGFETGGTGARYIAIAKNGTRWFNTVHAPAGVTNGLPSLVVSDMVAVTAGDWIEAHVYQDSGGAKNILASSYCAVMAVG